MSRCGCTAYRYCAWHSDLLRRAEQPSGTAVVQTASTSTHLQRRILALVKRLPGSWKAYHTYDSRRSPQGYPDLHLVRPATLPQPHEAPRPGRDIYAELKNAGEYPTIAQQKWLETLWCVSRSAECYIWFPEDEAAIVDILHAVYLTERSTQWMTRVKFPLTFISRSAP